MPLKVNLPLKILALALSVFITALAGEDYYRLLGVQRNADETTLKRAFKKLALKYHPDKNKDNSEKAKEMFAKVTNAYEVLSDPEKRRIYDHHGEEGLNQHQQQQNHGGGFHGEDVFSQFFGGGFGGGGFRFNFGGGGFHGHHQQQDQHEDFFAQSDVFQFNIGNLGKFYRRHEVWAIFFYKSNERESKGYKDLWRELGEKLYGIITVAAVNCHEEEELCHDEFSVYDVPKVKVFPASIQSEGLIYNGGMNYNEIANFAIAQMENFVRIVNSGNYEDFTKGNDDKLRVILFTARKTTPPLLKALSKELKGKLIFGEVRQTDHGLIQKFKVDKFPTFLVLTDPTLYTGVVYEGAFKKDQMMKFLREYAYQKPKRISKSANKNTGPQELTLERLRDKSCNERDPTICLLYIANPTETPEQYIPRLQALSETYFDDPLNFYYVTPTAINYNTVFDEIYGLPSVVVIKGKRRSYSRFDGDVTQDEKLKDFIDQTLSGSSTFHRMKGELLINGGGFKDEF